MKLVIGLGNPGEKYKNNRHNVGHIFVSWVQGSGFRVDKDIKILKADCFMNESGRFVKRELRNLGIKELSGLYVVHDDLDIPLGSYKIQFGKGPELHYGIQSIESELGTKDFWRIRIGVDNRDFANRVPGEDYVLQDFTDEEKKILEEVFPKIWDNFSTFLFT